jgi:hypothetical protein
MEISGALVIPPIFIVLFEFLVNVTPLKSASSLKVAALKLALSLNVALSKEPPLVNVALKKRFPR